MSSKGVFYIASGEEHIENAMRSAIRVKQLSNISITLITNKDPDCDIFDETIISPDMKEAHDDIINNIDNIPYERSVYLDTDTYLVKTEGIKDIFDALKFVDFAAALNTIRYSRNTRFDRPNVPDSIPMLNAGVLGLRDNDAINEFIKQWQLRYREMRRASKGDQPIPDQPALRAALANSNIRYHTLPKEYNFNIPQVGVVSSEVKLLHGNCRNYDEITQKLNQNPNAVRGYQPFYTDSPPPESDRRIIPHIFTANEGISPTRFYESIQEIGVLGTLVTYPLGGPSTGRARICLLKDRIENQGLTSTLKFVLRKLR